jgi:hypothetical protein
MNTQDLIAPCPFCGGKASIRGDFGLLAAYKAVAAGLDALAAAPKAEPTVEEPAPPA